MCNIELKNAVHKMFHELSKKANEIAENCGTGDMAINEISKMVSSKVSAESGGYIVDIYANLVAKIEEDDYFKDPEKLNDFYRLNLREQLNEKYNFDIKLKDVYEKGIKFKDINKLYVAAGSAAGTLAVGGILKFAISETIETPILGTIWIPISIIIAGAVIVGISSYLICSKKNKQNFHQAINKYLKDMENEILNWLVEIEDYLNRQVRTIYKN